MAKKKAKTKTKARKTKKSAKRKPAKRKPARKKAARRPKASKKIRAPKTPKPIGAVTHFYNEISVAIIRFNRNVPTGVSLYFKGATTDFRDVAKSIQYDHKPVAVAKKGKQVGIKVKKRVRPGDHVHFAE